MSLAGIKNRDATIKNRVLILDLILYSRFLQGSRIECQLTFERYCRERGVRVCNDAVLLDFWCGVGRKCTAILSLAHSHESLFSKQSLPIYP